MPWFLTCMGVQWNGSRHEPDARARAAVVAPAAPEHDTTVADAKPNDDANADDTNDAGSLTCVCAAMK